MLDTYNTGNEAAYGDLFTEDALIFFHDELPSEGRQGRFS